MAINKSHLLQEFQAVAAWNGSNMDHHQQHPRKMDPVTLYSVSWILSPVGLTSHHGAMFADVDFCGFLMILVPVLN